MSKKKHTLTSYNLTVSARSITQLCCKVWHICPIESHSFALQLSLFPVSA